MVGLLLQCHIATIEFLRAMGQISGWDLGVRPAAALATSLRKVSMEPGEFTDKQKDEISEKKKVSTLALERSKQLYLKQEKEKLEAINR